jgi:Restriction endonuclease
VTNYELPDEARSLIGYVSDLEQKARAAQELVAEQLEHVRAVNEKDAEELLKILRREHRERLADLKRREARIQTLQDRLSNRDQVLDEREDAFRSILDRTSAAADLIGDAWAEFERARSEVEAAALESKGHPAPAAAKAVRAKGKELGEAVRRANAAEWIVRLYEWHLPWITELREVGESESPIEPETRGGTSEAEQDPAAHWLTRQEYEALSAAERNQRSLDRYLKSRKTPWQLGRDYERYIGYLREQDGCDVTYQGIFKGLEDLGRDVLAEKDGWMEIIQCKRWAQGKTIHEKHIFQLYGTVVLARLEHPERQVSGTFTTTTSLSPTAHEVAKYLDIKIEEKFPLRDYPRIKCNISRSRDDPGEKIYHLPFDQQYDTTLIEPERGEFYATTVAEAESRGFRRAWRWKPGSPD